MSDTPKPSNTDWSSVSGEQADDETRPGFLNPKSSAGKPEPPDQPEQKMSRYEELCKTPSMKMEQADMTVMLEFSDVIARVNDAGKAVSDIHRQYPDLIIERVYRTMRDNLKETSTVMLRELHNMRNGRTQKKYDKRYVCVRCHGVFMVPLPADGICDECRAAMTPRSSPY